MLLSTAHHRHNSMKKCSQRCENAIPKDLAPETVAVTIE